MFWKINGIHFLHVKRFFSCFFTLILFFTLIFSADKLAVAQKLQLSPKPNQDITTVPGYPCYRTLDTVLARGASLSQEYPQLAQWIDLGDSWEKTSEGGDSGYDLWLLKLSNQTITGEKPALLLLSALNGNAFAPVELSLRFAEDLLAGWGEDAEKTIILNEIEVHILLVANPDGRKKAESQAVGIPDPASISWSKNTHAYACSNGLGGVSLSYNFSYEWRAGVPSACEPAYPGPRASSEPETIAVEAWLAQMSQSSPNKSLLLLNLDSYGNYFYTPYLYDGSQSYPEKNDLYYLANKLCYGNLAQPRNSASPSEVYKYGNVLDKAFGSFGIASLDLKLGYKIGGSAVASCTEFEQYILPENLHSLRLAAQASVAPYLTGYGPEISALQVSLEDGNYLIEGEADSYRFYRLPISDPRAVARVQYSLDVPPWQEHCPLQDVDWLQADDVVTIYRFGLRLPQESIPPGRHFLYLQAENDQGRVGLVRTLWVEGLDAGIRQFNSYLPSLHR